MDTDTITVRPGRAGDIQQVSLLAAAAMHDDSLAGVLAPDAPERVSVLSAYWAEIAAHAMTCRGHLDLVDDENGDPVGCAIWLASAELTTLPTYRLRQICHPHENVFDQVHDALHAAHPTARHWYLPLLVVLPGRQRAGIGTALLRHGCQTADRDGLPAYLEATTEDSARLYDRHGFQPHDEPIRIGDATVRPMWRDLHAGQTT